MAAVVVAGRRPLYELGAADLVVKQVDELTFPGLKNLFGMENLVEPQVRHFHGTCHPALPVHQRRSRELGSSVTLQM